MLQKRPTESHDFDCRPKLVAVPKKDLITGNVMPNTFSGTMVRVRLADDRDIGVFLEDNPRPTAKQVCAKLREKLGMGPETKKVFSLWIIGYELELQVRPKMRLHEMVEKWGRWSEKYTHNAYQNIASQTRSAMELAMQSVPPYRLIFRREAMLSIEDEKMVKDEQAIKLLYFEARNRFVTGQYIVNTVEEAIKLCAIQLQAKYGDFNREKHGVGTKFILRCVKTMLPMYILPKQRSAEWEQRIGILWETLVGQYGVVPHLVFLDILRGFETYGCTFFPACRTVPPSGYFERRIDHAFIGVRREGIILVDDDKKKICWYGKFGDLDWGGTTDSFILEGAHQGKTPCTLDRDSFGLVNMTMARNNQRSSSSIRHKATYITPQSVLIDSLAAYALYLTEKGTNADETPSKHYKKSRSKIFDRQLSREASQTMDHAVPSSKAPNLDSIMASNAALPGVNIIRDHSQGNLQRTPSSQGAFMMPQLTPRAASPSAQHFDAQMKAVRSDASLAKNLDQFASSLSQDSLEQTSPKMKQNVSERNLGDSPKLSPRLQRVNGDGPNISPKMLPRSKTDRNFEPRVAFSNENSPRQLPKMVRNISDPDPRLPRSKSDLYQKASSVHPINPMDYLNSKYDRQ